MIKILDLIYINNLKIAKQYFIHLVAIQYNKGRGSAECHPGQGLSVYFTHIMTKPKTGGFG